MAQDSGRTALYRLYNKDGALLYVGITGSPESRFAQHKGDKRWWREVARKTVEWYGTRDAAAAAEIAAIRHREPWYNREHSRGAVVSLELPAAIHADGLDLLCKLWGESREQVLGTLLIRELVARGLLGDGPCFHIAVGWPDGLVVQPQHYGAETTCCCGALVSDPPDVWALRMREAKAP